MYCILPIICIIFVFVAISCGDIPLDSFVRCEKESHPRHHSNALWQTRNLFKCVYVSQHVTPGRLGQRSECQGVHGSTPPPVLKGIARSPKSSQMLQQAVGTEARKPMQMCTIMCVNDVVCMCMCMCMWMSMKRCTRPLGQRPESQYKSYSGTYLYHIYQRQSCNQHVYISANV